MNCWALGWGPGILKISMSAATKYWICWALTLLSLPLLVMCLSHMVGPGMSGHFAEARNWFIAAMATTIVGCGAYLCAMYYKAKADDTYTETAMDIMNAAAKDIARAKADKHTPKPRR